MKAYILILNWNTWADTIECLESVFQNNYSNYQVIVADNNSEDNSLDYIKAWAENRLNVYVSKTNCLKHLSFPPISKPIPYREYNLSEANMGGQKDDNNFPLILIQTGNNLGFAGGSNVQLRYVLSKNDFEYVWLLNNDTVIKPDSLTELVKHACTNKKIGICGSTLIYYHQPKKIQALGGATYNKWLGVASHIGAFKPINLRYNPKLIAAKMDYIVGASMLVSKSFLQSIGLMCEDYFIYFEELDWALRSKGKYNLGFAPKSLVYHKEGVSTGGSYRKKGKSLQSDYFSLQSKLLFTRKFYPYYLPTVLITFFVKIGIFIKNRKWQHILSALKIIKECLK